MEEDGQGFGTVGVDGSGGGSRQMAAQKIVQFMVTGMTWSGFPAAMIGSSR